MYLCPVVYILVGECKRVCVSHTVKALLVDYSAAGQGFIVLLVTHQRVHAQDGWKKRRRLKNEHFLRKKRIEKEKAREQCWHWVDLLIGLQPYTRPPCTSRFQHRNQGKHEKKKKRKKKTCTLYGFSSRVLALTSATTADLLLLAGRSQINVQYTLFVIKNNEISASQGKKSMMWSGSRKSEICFQPSSYSDTINRESLPCFFVREIESIWLFIWLLNAVKCVHCNKLRGLFTTSISHFKSPSSNSSRVG